MKIKKLPLSDEVILAVADDVAKSFTLPKYEQFLTRRGLLSYNPNDFSNFNKINFIRDSMGEIDERLFIELNKANILSDVTQEALAQEGIVFESTDNNNRVSHQRTESTHAQTNPKVDTAKETTLQPVGSIKDNKKPSLPYFLVAFLVILVSLMFVRESVSDNMIFSLIVVATIIILVVVGILSLKHDGKISDDTFVNIIEKIQKMVEFFQVKK